MPMDADGSCLAPKITEGSIPRLQRRPLQLPTFIMNKFYAPPVFQTPLEMTDVG